MKLVQAFTVIMFALCVANVSANNFIATVDCQPCTITCGFALCYRITTDDYDKQICGTQSCSLNYGYMEIFGQCSTDFTGQACDTGVCYFLQNNGCEDNPNCTVAKIRTYTCQACTLPQNANCTTCYAVQQVGNTQPLLQICLGSSCSNNPTFNVSSAPCTDQIDIYENNCTCCYTIIGSPGQVGLCSNSKAIYKNAEFNEYARLKSSQNCLYVAFALLMCLIVMMFN